MPQLLKLIFLLSLSLPASSGADLIGSTCRTTSDPRICETTLRSDRRSSTANSEQLILIMIDAVNSKFSESLAYVNQLLKQSPAPPVKREALKQCVALLRFVIESSVGVARSAVSLGNPKFGEDAMRDAAGEANSCDRAVTGYGGQHVDRVLFQAAFIKRMTFLSALSNVAASMIRTME